MPIITETPWKDRKMQSGSPTSAYQSVRFNLQESPTNESTHKPSCNTKPAGDADSRSLSVSLASLLKQSNCILHLGFVDSHLPYITIPRSINSEMSDVIASSDL